MHPFKERLTAIIGAIYDELFELEKLHLDSVLLGEDGFGDEHLAQIEHYKEAVEILYNSPMIQKEKEDN